MKVGHYNTHVNIYDLGESKSVFVDSSEVVKISQQLDKLREENTKLKAVVEAAREIIENSDHTDSCYKEQKCICGYDLLEQALKELDQGGEGE